MAALLYPLRYEGIVMRFAAAFLIADELRPNVVLQNGVAGAEESDWRAAFSGHRLPRARANAINATDMHGQSDDRNRGRPASMA